MDKDDKVLVGFCWPGRPKRVLAGETTAVGF
jgi:hypothetical protein